MTEERRATGESHAARAGGSKRWTKEGSLLSTEAAAHNGAFLTTKEGDWLKWNNKEKTNPLQKNDSSNGRVT